MTSAARFDASLAAWAGHESHDVYHVEYAPDGRTFATAGGDSTARIWDAQSHRQRLVLRGHVGDVNSVSFDPGGRRLVTAGDDSTVRVWDATDGRPLAVLEGLKGVAVAALFTLDGHDVIGANRDALVVRWDVATRGRRNCGTPRAIRTWTPWRSPREGKPWPSPCAATTAGQLDRTPQHR